MTQALDFIETNKDQHLKELIELLSKPSISTREENRGDVEETAMWLKNHLEQIGLENVQLFETDRNPIVYGDYLKAGTQAPTVLVYGHYDVQPAEPLEDWESKPFAPVVKENILYARGATDNKGQFFAHIKAIEALIKTQAPLEYNIKIILEGEEEIGSINLGKFLEENKDLVKSDVCLISDTAAVSKSQPQIVYGLRGIVYADVTVKTLAHDVHSGVFGGTVPNAANELAQILSKLKGGQTQEVQIQEFYTNVRTLTEEEKIALETGAFDEQLVLKETGARRIVGTKDHGVAERAGAQPTLDINGIVGGSTKKGELKTIIPAQASAKISMRIVPNQTAKEIAEKFEFYIKSMAPEYVDIKVEILAKGDPVLFERNNPFFAKIENALESAFENKPVYALSGGSIYICSLAKDILGIDSILMGLGLPDDNLHAPNEKFDLDMFYSGIKASINFFTKYKAPVHHYFK